MIRSSDLRARLAKLVAEAREIENAGAADGSLSAADWPGRASRKTGVKGASDVTDTANDNALGDA